MSDFLKLINRSLLLLFIENEVNLCSLEISIEYYQEHEYSDTLELILQNPNFISNIKNLTLEFEEIADNMTKFLTFLYSNYSKFVQQIVSITKPFKLKSLFLDEILQIESLELLMKKSGDSLENFGINIYRSQQLLQLFELAIKYCSNIKFLYLYVGSTILQNLGQILPFKLESLNLSLAIINGSDLKVFLKNSQNTFIKNW
ncbi:unnamed protein product [Rhizophagus irregularis]|nr:unnamed protein product [Rhizophagus irregularis]